MNGIGPLKDTTEVEEQSELEAFILGLARSPYSIIKPSIINPGYVTVVDGRTGLDACEPTADECFRVLYAQTSP